MLGSRRFGLAFLAALILGFSGGAQATSFNLGTVAGPGDFAIGYSKDLGPFTDHYFFTIGPGTTLIFSATATNNTWRHGGIFDMDGTLSDASGIIQDADAALVNPSFPYPDRIVTWQSLILGPGNYYLSIFGNSESDVGVWNDYSGTISFAQTPLPTSLIMMMTALGGFGLLGWRRKHKAAAS